jgi:hypothetical protein
MAGVSARVAGVLVSIVVALAPAHAHAHPDVDEGRAQYERARFREALDAFARAESSDTLTLRDLALLLESRALVHHAMGNEPALESDLTRLAAIAPDHEFDESVPPELRDSFQRLRARLPGRLRLRATAEPTASGITIEVEVLDAPAAIVRAVRIRGRAGDGEWAEATDAPLVVTASAGERVQYYVEAVGPGGAVLVNRGSEGEPLVASMPAAPEPRSVSILSPGSGEEDDGGGGSAWIWVGVGAGLVALAAIIVSILVVRGDGLTDDTQATVCVAGWMPC